jgi:ribosomal protein S1
MMLEIGATVVATVSSTEVFGLFLRNGDDEIVVLITEVAWTRIGGDCRDIAKVGDRFRVKILKQSHEGQYVGSIRQAHPEDNPWMDSSLQVGRTLVAKVEGRIQPSDESCRPFGYLVEIECGLSGVIRAAELKKDLSHGDTVRVRIVAIDRERQELQLRASHPTDDDELASEK